MIEARFLRALAVGVLPVAGHGDQPHIFGLWSLPKLPRDLIAVHAWQAKIQQHDIRLVLHCRCQSGLTGVRRLDLMPERLQQQDEQISHISVVINDQHTRCLLRAAPLFQWGRLTLLSERGPAGAR